MVSGFVVRAGDDRSQHSISFLNGRFNTKLSTADTDGATYVVDTIRSRRGGPPFHLHFDQDEWFMVMEGQFRFRVGDEFFDLGPGDSIFGPRRVPHQFANVTETGRLLIMFQPAGTMEQFFATGMMNPMSAEFAELSRQHGMEVLGPPLPLEP